MITATIKSRKKVNGVLAEKREIKVFNSTEEARKYLKPIAVDMAMCQRQKKVPTTEIVGVSWDFDSEKQMLLEIKAFKSIENEAPED